MTYKVIGKRVKRVEDPRLLTGGALFVGDVNLPNMLYAAFFRSDYAHARIKSIDTSQAKLIPGVIGVYTAEDMGEAWEPGPPLVSPPPTLKDVVFNSRRQVPLVKDKVKHAGEIIAVVVAESRYIAEDAVEEIFVDYEPLPAVTNLEKSLEPGHTVVHDDLDSNLAAHLIHPSYLIYLIKIQHIYIGCILRIACIHTEKVYPKKHTYFEYPV